MKNTCRGAFFGKAADPQPAILSKKCTPLQIFNWFVYILGAPPSKQTSNKKVTIFKFIVCYIATHFQPQQLVRLNDWPMVNL